MCIVTFEVDGKIFKSSPRVVLQHTFFPPMYLDSQPTTRLRPGDMRMWTGMKVFIELRDGVTLQVPFREASKVGAILTGRSGMPAHISCLRTGNGMAGPTSVIDQENVKPRRSIYAQAIAPQSATLFL